MTTLRERYVAVALDPATPARVAVLFVPTAGPKVECRVCGARGYPSTTRPHGWMVPHLAGHAPCARCGRQLTLRLDGSVRVHSRCPKKVSETSAEVLVSGTGWPEADLTP